MPKTSERAAQMIAETEAEAHARLDSALERFLDELHRVVRSARADAGEKAHRTADALGRSARALAHDARARSGAVARYAGREAREHPLAAIGAAVGVIALVAGVAYALHAIDRED